MGKIESSQDSTYRIRLIGSLDQRIADLFGDFTITQLESGETLLVGQFSDQSALRGLIDQLWNFNITVLSVERIEDEIPKDPIDLSKPKE